MRNRMLIIEDDDFKADDLKREIGPAFQLCVVASVRDAVVRVLGEAFDAIILDMALPTFTAGAASSSGTAQPQGGVEILRALKSENPETPVIIVSQYPDLEVDGDFHSLEASPGVLSERYGIRVIGAVIYDFENRAWTEEFGRLLREL